MKNIYRVCYFIASSLSMFFSSVADFFSQADLRYTELIWDSDSGDDNTTFPNPEPAPSHEIQINPANSEVFHSVIL